MLESEALLDEVLPDRPIRQWVLTVPFHLRFLFAAYPELMSRVLVLDPGYLHPAGPPSWLHQKGGSHRRSGPDPALRLRPESQHPLSHAVSGWCVRAERFRPVRLPPHPAAHRRTAPRLASGNQRAGGPVSGTAGDPGAGRGQQLPDPGRPGGRSAQGDSYPFGGLPCGHRLAKWSQGYSPCRPFHHSQKNHPITPESPSSTVLVSMACSPPCRKMLLHFLPTVHPWT